MANKAHATTTSQSRQPQLVQVKGIVDITPGIRRIIFTGEGLADYPHGCEGWHIKLILPQQGQLKPELPILTEKGPQWSPEAIRPIIRTYSVRSIRQQKKEIDIEFAIHDDGGPALSFARHAKIGDWIGISSPGVPNPFLAEGEYIYMAGDPTSLPAIAALLEKMPKNTKGKVIIRVDTERDRQTLIKPHNVEIIWVCGNVSQTEKLVELFTSWVFATSNSAFWIAGEEKLVRRLRHFIRHEKGIDRQQIYAIPYWRDGYKEEDYHDLRHEIMKNHD